ncbi:NAD-dependent epimerase/dehydratase family protein [Amycolatopsis sp. 195334CR]|uniref:NAD-dependent epimerase/dehydratase family protein n=1 Tax=Amycolatopsis sp. 195334CR TaxID=2814588 RepID=UPI001A8FDBCB|nr:NAD-dependent epimerase/dehydratase family protein [Amycolatopsis sp. 195334CR]MBN6038375.1 NAD-dependent epimerase/dehydratase family protein [Amycolatopsis sp. 195334CR]
MDWNFASAVVTGGAGFVGSHLCERLLSLGTKVVCVDNFATGARENLWELLDTPGFSLVEADVTTWPADPPGDVDLVFHLASPASPRDYLRLPFETLAAGSTGTAWALDLARRHDARFLLASTSEVYGDPGQHPQREDYWGNVNPIGPRSVYDEAKRYAEAYTAAARREWQADTTIARIFNTYGPRMRAEDGRMIPAFAGQALRGEPLTVAGSGEQTRSICYVDDTVTGLLALAASTHPGPVNIGNPHELTVLEIAEEIRRLTGTRAPIRHIPAAEDDPRRRCPDIGLARAELGWAPEITSADGLARTLRWFGGPASRSA